MARNKYTILISGQPGAGSSTTSAILADKLDMIFMSPGQVFKRIGNGTIGDYFCYRQFELICKENGFIIPDLKSTNEIQAAVDLWKTPYGKDPRLHHSIEQLQQTLAREGGYVIDGKIALRMIPREDADYKIWLKASDESRAGRCNRNGTSLDYQAAVVLLREKETFEREEWKRIYGFDPWDQEKDADLVLDTTNIPNEEVAKRIIERFSLKPVS